MDLRDLRAGGGEFLDGDELLPFPTGGDVPGGRFSQAGDRDERRQELPAADREFHRVRAVQIDGREGEAPQIELVAYLQGGQQIVVLGGGFGVVPDRRSRK